MSSTIEHYFLSMDAREQVRYVIDRIKSIRAQKGISQLELSLRSNLSHSFIGNIERGTKQPTILTLIRIANALEVNPQDFFSENFPSDTKEQTKEKIKQLLELL